jgi:putative acetyltransferase
VHALDLKALRESRITFWTAWNSQNLMGCGALKELNEHEAEIKSMRTHAAYLKQGVAEKILMHIIEEAQRRRYSKVYLETGVHQAFFPAHKLYKKFGFTECPPFADYTKDSNSCFMVKNLERL